MTQTTKSSGKWWPHRSGLGAPLLTAFDKWFASSGGVWQTFIVVIAIVILEVIFPNVDPHGFLVLYVLTVYSGVTQPALAHVGAESMKLLHTLVGEVRQLVTELRTTDESDLATDRETNALVKRIAAHHGLDTDIPA